MHVIRKIETQLKVYGKRKNTMVLLVIGKAFGERVHVEKHCQPLRWA